MVENNEKPIAQLKRCEINHFDRPADSMPFVGKWIERPMVIEVQIENIDLTFRSDHKYKFPTHHLMQSHRPPCSPLPAASADPLKFKKKST